MGRLSVAQQDQAKSVAELNTELTNEIVNIEQQIASNETESESSEGILGTLKTTPVGFSQESSFEIVRQTQTGPVTIGATGTTVLKPGDLVRLVSSSGGEPVINPPSPAAPSGPQNATLFREFQNWQSPVGQKKDALFREFVEWQKNLRSANVPQN